MTGKMKKKAQDEGIEGVQINHARYAVIDIELTGLDEQRDSIVSIGAIRMSGGRIELGETFYRMMRPDQSPQGIMQPGSLPAGLLLEPDISASLSEFMAVCGSDVLIGHLIFTDLTFLRKEVKQLLGSEVKNPVVDTYQLYHWLMRRETPGMYSPRDVKLYEIASRLGITVSDSHDAINDAFITAQAFQRLMPMLVREGVKNVGDLIKIGDPSAGLR